MVILIATSGIFINSTRSTQGSYKVFYRAPHNLPGVNKIHFYSKQYAPKTISIVAPGVPWPRGRAGGRAVGPSVLEDCLYYR